MSLGNRVSRLSLCAASGLRNVSTSTNPLCFGITDVLFGEPLKRKKKIDPAILRQKDEKRKKKLEKQIRRLEKSTKQPKPIDECDVPIKLIDEREHRTRHLPACAPEQTEERIMLRKEWSRYKTRQHLQDAQRIGAFLFSQQRALDELRATSEELYHRAIQMDPCFLPYEATGPTRTPSIPNYASPDGDYADLTRKYEGEA